MRKRTGFTLVELAIVLVIVGLIVAGTLAGQSLVEQAKILKQVRALRELNLAVNTFRLKYNALPGDIKILLGDSLFPLCLTSIYMGAVVLGPHGNGDGVIEGVGDMENLCLWGQLYNSGLYLPEGPNELSLFSGTLPSADVVFADVGGNYAAYDYAIWPATDGAIMTITGAYGVPYNGNAVFVRGKDGDLQTPEYVYSIDVKLDDGVPAGGNLKSASVTSHSCSDNDNGPTTVTPELYYAEPGAAYNVLSADIVCSFIYRLN